MSSVLIIGATEMVEYCQEQITALPGSERLEYAVAQSLDAGLESVVRGDAGLVLLDSSIEQLSGDLVAGQIKGLMQEGAPKLVLVTRESVPAQHCDHTVVISDEAAAGQLAQLLEPLVAPEPEPAAPSRRYHELLPGPLASFLLGVLVGCGALLLYQSLTAKPAPELPQKTAPVLKLTRDFTSLRPDPAYSLDNAGWERWKGAGFEVLAFEEQGQLKAIQVLQAPGENLAPGEIRKSVGEMTGHDQWNRTGERMQQGLKVETGTMKGAEVTIYRDGNGAVVAYSVAAR